MIDDSTCGNDEFEGIRLDKDLVARLEEKLRVQIFWLIAMDRNGRQVLAVQEGTDARTFSSQNALLRELGKITLKEFENIQIIRFEGSPESAAVEHSVKPQSGDECRPRNTLIGRPTSP